MACDIEYEKLIVKHLDNIIYISDPHTNELLYINEKGRKMFQIDSNLKLTNQKCYQLLQGQEKPCEFCTNKFLNKDTFYQWTHYNSVLDRYFMMNDKLFELEEGRLVRLEIAVDITENEQRAQALEQRLTANETLLKCIQTLSVNNDQQAAINELMNLVADYYQGRRVNIYELDFDAETISCSFEWCDETIESKIHQLKNMPFHKMQQWLNRLNQEGAFYLPPLQENFEPEPFLADGDSLIAAPLIENECIVGFIVVYNPKVNANDLHLLKSVTYYIVNDIQKFKLLTKLETMSYIDLLTGVYNRNRYIHDLEQLKVKNPKTCGVLYLDINGLKKINDSFGHKYGDYIIKKAADLLCGVFSEPVYRIGGDEFVVICLEQTRNEFTQHINLLRLRLDEDDDLDASIGSIWEIAPIKIDTLINHADDLMYVEKQGFHNQVPLVENTDITLSNNERFVLFLKPLLNLQTNELVGAEACMYRQCSEGSSIVPELRPLTIESEGFLRFIDFLTIETVCKTLKRWHQLGLKKLNLSFRLSLITLNEVNFIMSIQRILKSYEIHQQQLSIILDEVASKVSIDELIGIIERLLTQGFVVALGKHQLCYPKSKTSELTYPQLHFNKSETAAQYLEMLISVYSITNQSLYHAAPLVIPAFEARYLNFKTTSSS